MKAEIKYGYISAYDSERKFGFICEKGGKKEYFFHISNLEYPFEITPEKTRVLFKEVKSEKGLCAVGIKEFIPEIEGKFKRISLPNAISFMTNEERYNYLKEQQSRISEVLNQLDACGISVKTSQNGWMALDLYAMDELTDPLPKGGHLCDSVPSGYADTLQHILRLLQKQVDNFNYDLATTTKGCDGENKTINSLKAVSLNYPVLHNVRLESSSADLNYSAETDTIVITDRAIFLIETKNYGGNGDIITVSNDGRWTLYDGHKQKTRNLTNPYKQVSDHIFFIKKFFEEHNIKIDLPIVPIIAIANDDVDIKLETTDIMGKVLRADLIGTYILQYIESTPSKTTKKTMSLIDKVLKEEKLPPKQYKVIDYCENIKTVCIALVELFELWQEDNNQALIIKERERQKRKEERQKRKEEQERKAFEEQQKALLKAFEKRQREIQEAKDLEELEKIKQEEQAKEKAEEEKMNKILAVAEGVGFLMRFFGLIE